MAVSPIVRNLRDGELVLADGASAPKTLTVVLDAGDLSWTERTSTLEIKDRGSISAGHTRPGDEESVSLSFTARWTQLIGNTVDAADPLQLYEFLTFRDGADLASTSGPGEQRTLRMEFRVTDPAGSASESIVFGKVYREQLTLSEADEANTIAFSGRDFEVAPAVSRI